MSRTGASDHRPAAQGRQDEPALRLLLLLILVTLLAGCAREAPPPQPAPPSAGDPLDARTPLPLLPMMARHQKENMRDHLVAVQVVDQATWEKLAAAP